MNAAIYTNTMHYWNTSVKGEMLLTKDKIQSKGKKNIEIN